VEECLYLWELQLLFILLQTAFQSIGNGIILFIIFLLLNNLPLIIIEKSCLKSSGYVSMDVSCVAGLALTVPSLLIECDKSYGIYSGKALSQIAMVVVLSAVVTPILVKKSINNVEQDIKKAA
jgi:2-keto-3-deoxygluconate permease